jgi:DNA-binding GntR family transcriptional regulator
MAQQATPGDGPKYERIADALRARIAAGEWEIGNPIPTIALLAAEYKAAGNTVERAIAELRKDGIVQSTQGSGIFVMRRDRVPSGEYVALTGRLDAMGAEVRQLRETVADLRAAVERMQATQPQS